MIRVKDFKFNYEFFYDDIEKYFDDYECCICLDNKLDDFWM